MREEGREWRREWMREEGREWRREQMREEGADEYAVTQYVCKQAGGTVTMQRI